MNTAEILAPYEAWVNADNVYTALQTWDRIQLEAHGTAAMNGHVDRRSRAAKINALKRAIERLPMADANGYAVYLRLELVSQSYSETHGFMHASYFTYAIKRVSTTR